MHNQLQRIHYEREIAVIEFNIVLLFLW